MWRQIQRAGLGLVLGCGAAAVAGPAQTPAAAQRMQALEHTALPQAQAALQSHLQHCDTQLAVMHARRAMVMAEEGSDSGVWLDMEVLTAQCQVTAQKLRDAIQQLEAERAQLQAVPASSTTKP